MKELALAVCLIVVTGEHAYAAQTHACADEAVAQAHKLLEFHFGPDDRSSIDETVKVLPPLKNPAGKDEYDVLEVWGHIYKGNYRMRFIYAQYDECVLMGQEILEFADIGTKD